MHRSTRCTYIEHAGNYGEISNGQGRWRRIALIAIDLVPLASLHFSCTLFFIDSIGNHINKSMGRMGHRREHGDRAISYSRYSAGKTERTRRGAHKARRLYQTIFKPSWKSPLSENSTDKKKERKRERERERRRRRRKKRKEGKFPPFLRQHRLLPARASSLRGEEGRGCPGRRRDNQKRELSAFVTYSFLCVLCHKRGKR